MKISTEIESIAKLVGEEKAVELVAKAGFDAWDFSMFGMAHWNGGLRCIRPETLNHPLRAGDYIGFSKKLRQIGEDNGIYCNQSHAPFPIYVQEVRDYMKRAIECTAVAGGKICVIHPDNYKSPEENAEIYFELLPFAKEHGVKIATENMWNWDYDKNVVLPAACSLHDNFLAHINAVNDDYFVACVDIGHSEMFGDLTSSVQTIKTLGKHVQALHIHDNDLKYDNHQIPFSMDIKFEPIVKALKEVDYQGEFTLEANTYMAKHQGNPVDAIKDLANSAKRLADMFDKF